MIRRLTFRAAASRGPFRLLPGACLVACLAALAGCSPAEKLLFNDPDYTMPEGVVDSVNARMILWADGPVAAYVLRDTPPADPDEEDVLEQTLSFRRYDPGTIHGMIFDHSVADEYRMYRREPNGGVALFTNVTVPRTRRWVETQYETFHFIDPAPSGYSPPAYVGRGIVEGIVNRDAPLTPLVSLSPTNIANIEAWATWYPPKQRILLRWTPVAGAERYLIHVYDFRGDLRTAEEAVLSGTPAPFYDALSTDEFIGYVSSNIRALFVGDPSQTGVTAFLVRPIQWTDPVKIRISAFDKDSRLIAMTQGLTKPWEAWENGDMGLFRGAINLFGQTYGDDGTYMLYRFGATTARDTTIPPPPPGGIG